MAKYALTGATLAAPATVGSLRLRGYARGAAMGSGSPHGLPHGSFHRAANGAAALVGLPKARVLLTPSRVAAASHTATGIPSLRACWHAGTALSLGNTSGTLRRLFHVVRVHAADGSAVVGGKVAARVGGVAALACVPEGSIIVLRRVPGIADARGVVNSTYAQFATPGFDNVTGGIGSSAGSPLARCQMRGGATATSTIRGSAHPSMHGAAEAVQGVKGLLRGSTRLRGASDALYYATTGAQTDDGYAVATPHPRLFGVAIGQSSASGLLTVPYIQKSPAIVLFNGENRLEALDNGEACLGRCATIQITLDPEAVNGYTSGVVLYKEGCYELFYDATTGLLTFSMYSDDGATYMRATTSTPYRWRKTLHIVFDGALGALRLYTNGLIDTGATASNGAISFARVSAAPLTLGSYPNGSSGYKGAISCLLFWNRAIMPDDLMRFGLSSGLVPSGFEYGLSVGWESTSIGTDGQSFRFYKWVSRSGVAFVERSPHGGHILVQSDVADNNPILAYNHWGIDLVDTGVGATPLTTEYTYGAPFRLWGNLLLPPHIPSGFRRYMNDVTLLLRMRKVVGTIECTLCELMGIRVVYNRTSGELYAVVGTDTSASLKNWRVSFGTHKFPLEGIPQLVAVRWNAEMASMDVMIGDAFYTPVTLTPTNQFVAQGGLTLADEADFIDATIVPTCLSYLAVIAYRDANAIKVRDPDGPRFTAHYASPLGYGTHALAENLQPSAVALNGTPWIIYGAVRSSVAPRASVYSDPLPSAEAIDQRGVALTVPPYRSPLPRVLSITASDSHLLTAIGNAGPTDAGPCISWFEIELVLMGSLYVAFGKVSPTRYDVNRNEIQQFQIPLGLSVAGKRLRFVVQSSRDGSQTWRSNWSVLETTDPYNNNPPGVINLAPVIVQTAPADVVAAVAVAQQAKRMQTLAKLAVPPALAANARSRYKGTNIYTNEAGERSFTILSDIPEISDADEATFDHTVTADEAGFPDRLMANLYGPGHEDLWWMIARINAMIDPIAELTAGAKIRVPTPGAIRAFLARASSVKLLQEG